MNKKITIRELSDIDGYVDELRSSAEQSQIRVCELSGSAVPLEFLYKIKFEEIGCDPLDSARDLNFIEQVNQSFTYAASLKAAEYLLRQDPGLAPLTLNLGTRAGWDIEGHKNGGLVAEVFAAVNPQNNTKLKKDIEKVAKAGATHRYVFFMCPGIEAGPYEASSVAAGIQVISLGSSLW